jgi:hypothetical protein
MPAFFTTSLTFSIYNRAADRQAHRSRSAIWVDDGLGFRKTEYPRAETDGLKSPPGRKRYPRIECAGASRRDNIAAPHFRTIQASPKDLPQGLREIELAANPLIGLSSWRMDHADF